MRVTLISSCILKLDDKNLTGLSLRARSQGFPPATMNVAPGYFHSKIEEKETQKNP